LALDRENLSLTLAGVNLFLSRSLDAPDTLPGQPPKLAFSNRDLDSLLSIVYDNEERQGSTENKLAPFTLLDLMSLLRKWHVSRRKFLHFAALKRAVLQEIGVAGKSDPPTSARSPKAAPTTPPSSNAGFSPNRFDFPSTSVGVSSNDQEKDLLRSFLAAPSRRLLLGGGLGDEDGAHSFTDGEIDELLVEKNSLSSSSALSVGAPVPTKGKELNMSGIHLFLASLKYLEQHAPPGGFMNIADLLAAIREHYKLLAAQMAEALKYLKTSKRLFTDPRITITWNLQREVLMLYTASEGDLLTLPLVRKLERERYQESPYSNLSELIDGVKQALVDSERAIKSGSTDSDRARVLAALVAASQVPGSEKTPARRKEPEHQPLLPLAFLEAKAAEEQLTLLLSEYTLFTVLQHIAMLSHHLTMKAAELNATVPAPSPKKGTVPQPTPKRAVEQQAIPTKPAYATWHSFNLAIHESVLDFNRLRTEVFNLLNASACPLLSLSKTPVPITYESVDRLVKACGLMHADMLSVLQHLNDRGVRLKTLPELAARVKSFYLERRKAEQQSARYAFMKGEIVAYLSSEACHLFLNAAAKLRAQADLEDAATFVQFMQASGGSLKSSLSLIHALEAEELAFDSLDAIIEGMHAWSAREVLKKQFLPFVNNANLCHLFDKVSGAHVQDRACCVTLRLRQC
jgi:hypothetical protein